MDGNYRGMYGPYFTHAEVFYTPSNYATFFGRTETGIVDYADDRKLYELLTIMTIRIETRLASSRLD